MTNRIHKACCIHPYNIHMYIFKNNENGFKSYPNGNDDDRLLSNEL